MKKVLIEAVSILLVLLACLLLPEGSAAAECGQMAFEGKKLKNKIPVVFWIDKSISTWKEEIYAAEKEMEKASGLNLFEIKESKYEKRPTQAVDGLNRIYLGKVRNKKELGVTYTKFVLSTGQIKDADIIVNKDKSFFKNKNMLLAQFGYKFKSLIMHEMMHSLGFDHSKDQKSLLFETIHQGEEPSLSPKDVENILCVYGKD